MAKTMKRGAHWQRRKAMRAKARELVAAIKDADSHGGVLERFDGKPIFDFIVSLGHHFTTACAVSVAPDGQ